jgi:iron-sulfur cluster repair protein YtfE (RIC family)
MRLAHEARRIARQHAFFEELRSSTRLALERGGGDERRKALHTLATSLEAHFTLEEHVQFPALHGLHAESADELTELVAQHHRFREDLAALAQQGGADADGARSAALASFERLAEALRQHEDREEALLERAQID